MRRVIWLATATIFLLNADALAVLKDGHRYGAGLQWLDPVGLSPSFTADIANLPLSVQAILGLDDFPSPAGRARIVFAGTEYLDGYAYGLFGIHTRRWHVPFDGTDTDTHVFAGLGAGVEWDWRDAEESLPPLSWSVELGFNDDDVVVGFGVHYTF